MSVSSPSKPRSRSVSVARRPASEAPTTTMRRSMASLFNRNRAGRALPHGLVHARAQIVRWRLVQDVQHAVVADLEHLRRRLHAESMEVACAQIDDDFHDGPSQAASVWPLEPRCEEVTLPRLLKSSIA